MRLFKKILLVILVAFLIIQFIRPARNQSTEVPATDITHVVAVPPDVQSIMKKACYDCHSNNTVYPWYMNIQPVAWFMADHVKEGKRHLNFSEFGSYKKKKQDHKLEEIVKEVKEGHMPISSYKLMHPEARLSDGERAVIVSWADSLGRKG